MRSKMYVKIENLGRLTGYESETVCGKTSKDMALLERTADNASSLF